MSVKGIWSVVTTGLLSLMLALSGVPAAALALPGGAGLAKGAPSMLFPAAQGNVFVSDGVSYTIVSDAEVYVGAQDAAGTAFAGQGAIVVPPSVMCGSVSFSVTGVNNYAFSSGPSGTAAAVFSVQLPETVKRIGAYAFYGCSNLRSLVFADGSALESIGSMAFANCVGLQAVTVPRNVTYLGQSCFANCAGIETLVFEDPLAAAPSLFMDAGAFSVMADQPDKLQAVQAPVRLSSVPPHAFENRSALVSFTSAGGSLGSMGDCAFRNCSGLQLVEIPPLTSKGVKVNSNTFTGMDSLRTIVFLGAEDYGLSDDLFTVGYGEREGISQRYIYADVKNIVYFGAHTSTLFPNANHYEHISYYSTRSAAENSGEIVGDVFVRDDVALYDLADNIGKIDGKGSFVYDGRVPEAGLGKVWCYPGASISSGTSGPVSAYPVDEHDLSAAEAVIDNADLVYHGDPLALSYHVIDGAGNLLVAGRDFSPMLADASGGAVDFGSITASGRYTFIATGMGAYSGAVSHVVEVSAPVCDWTRLSGDAAFATQGHMQESAFQPGQVDTVILAGKHALDVAAAAGGLAGVRRAPIIVTDGDALTSEARYLLGSYRPTSVVLLGIDDPGAMSSSIRQLLGSSTSVSNSFDAEDSAAVAGKMYALSKRSGYWRSTSTALVAPAGDVVAASLAGTHAYRTSSPVFLVGADFHMPDDVVQAIVADGFTKVIFVGLTPEEAAIASSQLAGNGFVGNIDSWYSSNPCELSAVVANAEISSGLSGYDKATVVSAYDLRGLASAVSTCGQNLAPLLVADDVSGGFSAIEQVIKPNYHKVRQGYLFGPRRFLPAEFQERLESLWQPFDSKDLRAADVKLSSVRFAADGSVHIPELVVTDTAGNELSRGVDYEVSCWWNGNDQDVGPSGPSKAGVYTVAAIGKGDYSGATARTFYIGAPDLSHARIVASPATALYTGQPVVPGVSVYLDGIELAEGKEYDLAISNNVNVGDGVVTVVGKGDYSGVATTTFPIRRISLDGAVVQLSRISYVYNGKPQQPGVSVKIDGISLQPERDYTVTILDAKGQVTGLSIGAGVYTVAVSGAGCYEGAIQESYTIKKASQTIKVNVKKAVYKAKRLRKIKKGGSFKIGAKAGTPVTYSLPKKAKKAGVSVTKKGKVSVKRTCKKGKYVITVTAKETANYAKAMKEVTVRVK